MIPHVCGTSAINSAESIVGEGAGDAASRRDYAVQVPAGGNQTSADRHQERAALAFFWLCLSPQCRYFVPPTRQGLLTNRTQLIRDLALAFGRTCIACGREAVSSAGKLSGMRSSSIYGEGARSQLEMEEQCPHAPRATDPRASVRVVWSPARSDAASRLVDGSVGPSSKAGRALPSLSLYRRKRLAWKSVVLAIATRRSAL